MQTKTLRKLFLAIIPVLLFLSSLVHAIGIGISPGVIYLGYVPRGKTVEVHFYLISNANYAIPVYLSYIPVHVDILNRKKIGPYKFDPKELSEESISSWIKFPLNPYILDPKNVKVIKLPDGTELKYNSKATFLISVPKDAEPGYHVGAINIVPKLNTKIGGGTGVATVGVARLIFFFRVPGVVQRTGKIIDIEVDRLSKDEIRVDVLFKNTGTVTMTASLANVVIYDSYGHKIKAFSGSIKKVAPGQTVIMSAYWRDPAGIKPGEAKITGTVKYLGGKTTSSKKVYIPAEVTAPRAIKISAKPKRTVPWWLIIMILSLIGLYIYWKM